MKIRTLIILTLVLSSCFTDTKVNNIKNYLDSKNEYQELIQEYLKQIKECKCSVSFSKVIKDSLLVDTYRGKISKPIEYGEKRYALTNFNSSKDIIINNVVIDKKLVSKFINSELAVLYSENKDFDTKLKSTITAQLEGFREDFRYRYHIIMNINHNECCIPNVLLKVNDSTFINGLDNLK